ncbi:MAG: hypothetical protein VZR06_00460 [Butyrivibrio sp.]|nr:hypothetical protein [Butyrivibrio sp. LB2008]MEE3493598.1 hypothetical protein [Butyrivibrio sp.]
MKKMLVLTVTIAILAAGVFTGTKAPSATNNTKIGICCILKPAH